MSFTLEHKIKQLIKKLHITILWIVIWQFLSFIIRQEILFPSPYKVLNSLITLLQDPTLLRDISHSLVNILGGVSTSIILAVLLSLLALKYDYFRSFISPLLSFIKSVPIASFILMAFLLFGSQGLSSFICFLIAIPILYTNILEGFHSVPVSMMEAARVYNMPESLKLRYIYLPHAVPFFLSGCKVAIGLAWKSGVAAEVIGLARYSLGERLYNAKLFLDTSQVFAITIVIILLSWLTEKCLMFCLSKLCNYFV